MIMQTVILAPHQTYPLRQTLLRSGRPPDSCRFEGDEASDARHFGVRIEPALAGVVSLHRRGHSRFRCDDAWQFRGMAVAPEFQRRGVGRCLWGCIESHVAACGGGLVWCNARLAAVRFYEKLGFRRNDGSSVIADVGRHFLMSRLVPARRGGSSCF